MTSYLFIFAHGRLMGCICCILLLLASPTVLAVEVLASIKPLQLIAQAITSEAGSPKKLLPIGASPHHYQMKPSDKRKLLDAQVILWVGPEMETFLSSSLASLSGGQRLIQLTDIPLPADTPHHHDGHVHSNGHLHHGSDPQADPHLWLSPEHAVKAAQKLASVLQQLDPEQAAVYAANLKLFEQSVTEFIETARLRFSDLQGRPYVVYHNAYYWLEQALGIEHLSRVRLNPELSPGIKHMLYLRGLLKEQGEVCLILEPQFEPRLVAKLCEGLDLIQIQLDPLAGNIEASPKGYLEFISGLAEGIAGCLEQLPPKVISN